MKKGLKITVGVILIMLIGVTVSYGFGVGDLQGDQSGLSSLENAGKQIMGVISAVGVVVSVVVLAALGIKYMLGSAVERAEYKNTLGPYLIGAAITFGASTIVQIIYLFVK